MPKVNNRAHNPPIVLAATSSIHVPFWLSTNGIQSGVFHYTASIFVFSFILGIVFKMGDSLWLPLLGHAFNNFFWAVLIFG